MNNRLVVLGVVVSAATMSAAAPPPQPKAGAPLPGLTPNQLLLFREGLEYYRRDITIAQGLGPAFNQRSCASCHESPIGGWGETAVEHFVRIDGNGQFDFLEEFGGPVRQQQVIDNAAPACRELLPPEANRIRERVTPSVLAFGLVEAIPDETLIALEDPDDLDGDGISGRAHRVRLLENPTGPLRVGRFGWKSQIASVLSFSGDAARTEMGMTNAVVREETPPNGVMGNCDPLPIEPADVEDRPDGIGLTFVQAVTAFQRYLAPPPQAPRGGMAGEAIFNQIGCAKCHVTTLQTGNDPSLEAALRDKTIRVYSDFLLHDMGARADGLPEGEAQPTEMRTPPLWNLRTRPVMMHDGGARDESFAGRVTEAIEQHSGEGQASRDAFFKDISSADRAKVIAFLDSLGRDDYDVNSDGIVDIADFNELVLHAGDTDVSPDEPWGVADLNQNRRLDPDELQQLADMLDVEVDCNQNGVSDWIDVSSGASTDIDGDFRPDECPSASQCNRRTIRMTGSGGAIDNGTTLRSTINVVPSVPFPPDETDRGRIKGIRLTLRISHGWINDLRVTLKRGNSSLILHQTPCGGASDLNGSYSFIERLWWNPSQAPAAGTVCQGPTIDLGESLPDTDRRVIIPGTFERSMSGTFGNASPYAAWELSISDQANQGGNDTGTLHSWTLEILYEPRRAEWDCNGDSMPDCVQIDLDPDLDCDGNGQIDFCQLADTGADCDADGVLDRCQVADGTEPDCDADGLLDICELDTDTDGVPDECDGCPLLGNQVVPGPCGCGSVDGDDDQDGTPNCFDGCPEDEFKTEPGLCGCGTEDTQSDNDGVPDCFDGCPEDGNKTSPGQCGCNVIDVHSDSDGVADCVDGCPTDGNKTSPGVCGCGVPDTDSDGDGTPDCVDASNEAARLVAVLDPTAPSTDGSFGAALRSDGGAVIAGAAKERVAGTDRAGAAYVFGRDALGRWLAPARLSAPTPEADSGFGSSVAVQGDIAVVGAPQAAVGATAAAGRAFVFRRTAGAWQLEQSLAMAAPCASCAFGASVAVSGGRVFVGSTGDLVGGSVRVFERVGGTWSEAAAISASDAAGADRFGWAIAADGDTLAVAAVRDDAGGVLDRGSAYVFVRSQAGAWSQQAKLEPSVAGAGNAFFGNDIDVRGNRVVVGANAFDIGGSDRGAVFVFRRTGTSWSEESVLLAPDGQPEDKFGFKVAIGADGLSVVASAPQDNIGSSGNAGTCRLFTFVGGQWSQRITVTTPQVVDPDGFGAAIALSADMLVVGAPLSRGAGTSMSGRAFVFDTAPLDCNGDGVPDTDSDNDGIADCSDGDDDGDGASDLVDECPNDAQKVLAGQCGCNVIDVHSDSDGVADCVDGCPTDGNKTSPGQCGCGNLETDTDQDGRPDCVDSSAVQTASLAGPLGAAASQFGWAVSIDGEYAVSGAPQATVQGAATRGMAAIFRRSAGGDWVTDAVLTAPNGIALDRFGARVAIDGDIAVVAAPQAREQRGTVYVYRRSAAGTWVLEQALQPQVERTSLFGGAVAVSNGIIAVGAPSEGVAGASQRGAVYVYAPSGPGSWSLETRLVAGDGAANDAFGHSLALRDGLLVCGAPFDDGGSVLNHGSAYLFRRTAPGAWQLRGKLASPTLITGASFGRDVSTDGVTVAVNAPDEPMGAVYAFRVSGANDAVGPAARLTSALVESGDAFACGVAVSGNRIAVGSLLDDIGTQADAGSVRVFTRTDAGAWAETDIVTLPGGRAEDLFGWVVALDGGSLAVGAIGVDVGDVTNLGSVSIFDLTPLDCDEDGQPDADTDADGVADCNDRDDDGDGTLDAADGCPRDPLKTSPGTCGCGVADSASDGDGDGIVDCADNCPSAANASQSDCDGDGQGDSCESQADCNGNGTIDACDVAGGTSSDFNGNGTPDECESGTLLVPSEFASIQAAIDAAPQAGGIVLVSPGVYIGAVNMRGKAITVHAPAGPAQTVIDGAAVAQSLVTFNGDEGPATVFSGFTVRRGTLGTPVAPGSPFLVGGGMFISRASPTIVNCRISQCRGDYGAGAYLYFSDAHFKDCVFANNAALEYGGGAQAFGGSPVFEDCEFTSNVSAFRGGGVHLVAGAVRIERTVMRDNVAFDSGGAVSWDVHPHGMTGTAPLSLVDTVLEFNFALGAGGGLWVWDSTTAPVQPGASLVRSRACGNLPDEINGPYSRDGDTVICVDCNVNGIPDSEDIDANPSLDCDLSGTIDACDIAAGVAADRDGNGKIDECETGTLFVPSEYGSITAAIQAAQPGSVVWIAPGTYAESINPQGKAITIRGGGPGTVIDGSLLSTSILVVRSGEGPGTVIEDLVFRNGIGGTPIAIAPAFRGGGGAYIDNASPTLRRCTFEQCRAEYGGGAYLVGFGGRLEDCVFRSNTALSDGGGLQILNLFATPTFPACDIVNCVFKQNVAGVNGGGMHLVDFIGHRVEGCTVEFNQALGTSNPWNAFYGVGGGISWFQTRNQQGEYGLPLAVMDCVVENNIASIDGGGLFVHNGLPADVSDSVFCDNSPANISGVYDDLGGNELCANCPGDFDDDGRVSGIDLGLLLGQWGAVGSNFADLNLDGVVSGADMGILLGEWGFCAN